MSEIEWVPVKERLPEGNSHKHVTIKRDNDARVVNIARYSKERDVWVGIAGCVINNVLAWAEFPSPYNGDV